MDQRTACWAEFLDNEQGVCVATRMALQALPFGSQAFTVYPELPSPELFLRCTLSGSALLSFEENEQDKVDTFSNDEAEPLPEDA
jgi:hypothetical protein